MKFRKLAVAILFTAALMIPTTFGIPLTFMAFSPGVPVAEARTRQSGAWLREMRISHGRMFWSQNGTRVTGSSTALTGGTRHIVVPANRSSIRMTAIRETGSNRAQVRFRINNGSWTSWSRSNAQRRVSIPANNGTTDRSVRVRVQVRSENGRFTNTYNYRIHRASNNTRANRLTVTGGTLTPRFNPNTTSYRVNLPWGTPGVSSELRFSLRAAHPRANVVWDNRSISRAQNVWTFGNHPRNNSWTTRRTVNTSAIFVRFGETTRVRFRIMGAYNTMVSGSNRTRIYTVTIHRGPASYQEIVSHFLPLIQGAANTQALNALHNDARSALSWFQWSQSGHLATDIARAPYLTAIDNAVATRRAQLP